MLDEGDKLRQDLGTLFNEELRAHDVLVLVDDVTGAFGELGVANVVHAFSDEFGGLVDENVRV